MSLKSRLEAKARRRVVVPVLITNPDDDVPVADTYRQLAAAAELLYDDGAPEILAARADADAAAQKVADHFEMVAFLAMPSSEFESYIDEFYDASKGEVDQEAFLPVLAARCAEDSELNDVAWWRELLAGEAWTAGEKLLLYKHLYNLNYAAPSPNIPKG